jgi:hypothetical protein
VRLGLLAPVAAHLLAPPAHPPPHPGFGFGRFGFGPAAEACHHLASAAAFAGHLAAEVHLARELH